MRLAHTKTNDTAHSVLAGGQRISQRQLAGEWATPALQEALARARQYGHALCECRGEPLKLQVRLREGKFHLAVWPEEGPEHDVACAFFRDELTEPKAVGNAEQPLSAEGAATALRTAVFMRGLYPAGGDGPEISVQAFLYRLMQMASLCRWSPGWVRDWGRVRYEILAACKQFNINGVPAENWVFAPRPYRDSQRDALHAEWYAFLRRLRDDHSQCGIVIAPLRRLVLESDLPHPPCVQFSHLPGDIALDAGTAQFLQRDKAIRRTRSALEGQSKALRFLGVFIIQAQKRGGLWATRGAVLPVHPTTYIPINSLWELPMVDKLLAEQHVFERLLPDLTGEQATPAHWIVRHVIGPEGRKVSRAALQLLHTRLTSDVTATRAEAAAQLAAAGVPVWSWQPDQQPMDAPRVPPLPPKDWTAPAQAGAILAEIATCPDADYGYGHPIKFFNPERKAA